VRKIPPPFFRLALFTRNAINKMIPARTSAPNAAPDSNKKESHSNHSKFNPHNMINNIEMVSRIENENEPRTLPIITLLSDEEEEVISSLEG
jgi:hypothetical protein